MDARAARRKRGNRMARKQARTKRTKVSQRIKAAAARSARR
jgi:hypothetical protein